MPAAAASKKASSKTAAKNVQLPAYRDLIRECIVDTASRDGVSRVAIKKYVEDKYKIEVSPITRFTSFPPERRHEHIANMLCIYRSHLLLSLTSMARLRGERTRASSSCQRGEYPAGRLEGISNAAPPTPDFHSL